MRMLAVITGLVASAGSCLVAGGTSGSGLVVLHHSANGALSMVGNTRVEIPARAVYVNSSAQTAVQTTGEAVLDVPNLYVVGGARFGGRSRCTGTVTLSAVPYADPLAGLTYPDVGGLPNRGSRSISGGSTVVLEPGYYSGGITVSGNSNVTFAPGVHYIGGSGLRVTSGTVIGEGVTLVMVHGSLDIAGASTLELSPPESGGFDGVVIAQPPSNTAGMELAGGSGVYITGSIYAPAATLTLVGNSEIEGEGPQMGDLVVASRVNLRGTATIKIGRPSSPAISLPNLPLYD